MTKLNFIYSTKAIHIVKSNGVEIPMPEKNKEDAIKFINKYNQDVTALFIIKFKPFWAFNERRFTKTHLQEI